MSTEKAIKNQAKESLRGNTLTVIAAIVFFCVILIAADSLTSLAAEVTQAAFADTQSEWLRQPVLTVLCGVVFIAVFLLSPIVNGIFKMFCNIALYNKTELSDMFFYFRSPAAYLKTCELNIFLTAFYMILSYGFDIYHYAVTIAGRDLQDATEFGIIEITLAAALVLTVVIKILIYLIFVHYQLLAYAMFDNIPVAKAAFGMFGFSLRHLGAAIKLLASFIGWIALCFFVVPAFYVLPYLLASMSTSAKWLFSLDKDRGLLC